MNEINRPLHSYQKSLADFIAAHDKSFVIVDMGLGKTLATLQAIENLFDQFMIQRVLVVAPLRVATTVWPAEIVKWGFNLSYSVACGTVKQRNTALARHSQITIINRENIPWLIDTHEWEWDTLIIDESSSFKSHSASRFKVLKKELKHVSRTVLLTGTPAPNSLLELWSQVYLLDQGERLDTAFTRYRERYFESDYFGYTWTMRPGAAEQIYDKISDLTITMREQDYLTLPEKIEIDVSVTLPESVTEKVTELKNEFITTLGETEITAANAAVMTGKLLQCSAGALYTDDEGNWEWLHDEKLNALEQILEEARGENVLVGYMFRSDAERIKKKFPIAVDVREPGAIDAWNRGEIKLMMAHPASAGHGLNLQTGGHVIVWFSLPWSGELWQQFTKRVHRQGQERPVRVYRIIAEGVIDRQVLEVLGGKKTIQEALIEGLKGKP